MNKSGRRLILQDMLSSLGVYDVWVCQGVGNKQLFLNLGKQRFKNHFLQNWCAELKMSIMALCYRANWHQCGFQSIFKCC